MVDFKRQALSNKENFLKFLNALIWSKWYFKFPNRTTNWRDRNISKNSLRDSSLKILEYRKGILNLFLRNSHSITSPIDQCGRPSTSLDIHGWALIPCPLAWRQTCKLAAAPSPISVNSKMCYILILTITLKIYINLLQFYSLGFSLFRLNLACTFSLLVLLVKFALY